MTKPIETFDYTKEDRFAVVKKQPRWLRHRCDFKHLHSSRGAAEEEAVRLTEIHKTKFYIIEIVGITSSGEAEITDIQDRSPAELEIVAAKSQVNSGWDEL